MHNNEAMNGGICGVCEVAFGTVLPGRITPVTQAPWTQEEICVTCYAKRVAVKNKFFSVPEIKEPTKEEEADAKEHYAWWLDQLDKEEDEE